MAPTDSVSRGARLAGLLLLACGVVGLVTGLVPLTAIALHVLGCATLPSEHLGAHGFAALGMGPDWAMLSSSCGAFLGALLVAAGIGWRRGRAWAPLVTLLYALNGLQVTGVDLFLFGLYARPGPMRTAMVLADGMAFAVASTALVGVAIWRARSRDGGHS